MDHIYAELEKIVCGKVVEFEKFLQQFQENFSGTGLTKIIEKKNELKLFCAEYVHKEYPLDTLMFVEGKYIHTADSVVYFRSMKYMHNRVKELDKLFAEFLDTFINMQVSK
ncbi:hypothetical protein SAMN05421741_1376 [Paenimyroides ummariense]|uniref:Uncharacterized protein n=1 Tax=Paenimyroides ummariense TaxID=913024 RepID=A0A1I5G8Z2_9FLAO|nr:hypothetical protein [Paenimyroides ummariense]SFO32426.1 hypothetical protein SAMN05421741_1376 [Paenimyroides ummariense]